MVNAEEGTEHIPAGQSVWEFGTNKRIKSKANGDYSKRTADPGDIVPGETTFVFVTSRRWPLGKKPWGDAKRAEGTWKDVRVLDADDLESMLEQAPAIALWLAEQMGKITGSFQSLEEYWEDWSSETTPAISTDLVVAGREENSEELVQWAAETSPPKRAVHAHTPDEAIAFLAAALYKAESAAAEATLARTIIVKDESAFQAVKRWKSPLIIIPNSEEIENPTAAVSKGHHVLVPLGYTAGRRDEMTTLVRPTRHAFAEALQELGFEEAEAEALAVRTGCTLSAYRRHCGAFDRPDWATPERLRLLIPAFLAGAWVDDHRGGVANESAGDRDVIAALAGQPFHDYRAALTELTTLPDAPVMRVKGYWRITAPVDALHLLAPYLTDEHLSTLREKAFDLLSQRDPALDLPPGERYMAQIRGKVLGHSGALREGILGTFALLAHFTEGLETLHTSTRPQDVGFHLVRDLLSGAPAERWLSLAGNLDDLAEVSPKAFLSAIEESLAHEIPSVMALFEEEGDVFTSGCRHANLLWGLESLAWEPRLLPRACLVLAGLAARDPGGRWANRPSGSLRDIFLPWRPATFASLDDRIAALDAVLAAQPEVGWSLLVSLAPKHHDVTSGTRHPHWLPVAGVAQRPKTVLDLQRNTQPILDRIETQIGTDAGRWGDLFDANLSALSPEYRRRLLHTLIDRVRNDQICGDREALWTKIRRYHYILSLRDETSSDETEPLVELEALLSPDEPMARHRWLFENAWVDIPGTRRTEQEIADTRRSEALDDIVTAYGLDGVIDFVEKVGDPVQVAFAAAKRADVDALDELVQQQAARKPSDAFCSFLAVYVSVRHSELGWTSTKKFLAQAKADGWPTESVLSVFLGLPVTQETWEQIEEGWEPIANAYWKRVNLWLIDRKDSVFYEKAMVKALDVGRAADVIEAIGGFGSSISVSTPLICDALRNLATEAQSEERPARNLGHSIVELFKALDERDDISDSEIAALEFPFCKAFEHTDRPEMACHRLLADSPSHFTTLIKWLYKRDDGQEDENAAVEELRNAAEFSWTVLHSWRLIPGRMADGTIDEAELLRWIQEARELCREAHRLTCAHRRIGELLAHAPADENGVWPCLPVRNTVESIADADILRGLHTGVVNRRGVTTRSPYEGGQQERELAAKYRSWADAQRARWPAVATELDDVAEHYEREANMHDDDVDRRRLRD
ncbi:hypothetical protein ACMDCT_04040 [Halomonadaceae bacterium KBTZ08]